ncbi:hypothetical protein [Pedobacter sp. Leaf170]|uniref:hypothetical protein n=1 Tax=Pedobacter sp. Leaf170 TaxID=2876558 RepID=UPI001E36EB27|nr:hypothetical protein [Pedobacter sp. Leaf170]
MKAYIIFKPVIFLNDLKYFAKKFFNEKYVALLIIVFGIISINKSFSAPPTGTYSGCVILNNNTTVRTEYIFQTIGIGNYPASSCGLGFSGTIPYYINPTSFKINNAVDETQCFIPGIVPATTRTCAAVVNNAMGLPFTACGVVISNIQFFNCPIDDYISLLFLVAGALGFLYIRKFSMQRFI